MPVVHKREQAKRDLVDRYVYLAESAHLDVSERFLANTEKSFNDLATNPMIGVALTLQDPQLAGIRKWHVTGFENVLIFYMPRPNGVSIIRVLHAAQDWEGLLKA